MANKFCVQCGQSIPDPSSRFCVACGAPLAAPAAAPQRMPEHLPGTPVDYRPPEPVIAVAPLSFEENVVAPPAPQQHTQAAASHSGGGLLGGLLGALGGTQPGAAPSGGGLLGEIVGAVESFAPMAASIANAAGAGELAAGLNLAAGAAQAIDSIFHVVNLPNGRKVVIGGYQRDADDANDVPYDRHEDIDPSRLPPGVDLRQFLSEVEEQGELGSCTANAVAGAHEYLQRRANQGRYTDVSRLFIYYLERQLEGTVGQDSGAQLRSGMKVLAKWGVCSEDLWPYDVDRYTDQPPDEAFEHAKNHLIDEYQRVPIDVHAWKVCLAEGYPVVFGTQIFQSFEDDGSQGVISMPRRHEKNLGGHAMLCVGYDESRRLFIVRNSWGSDWGDGGYCYFPYDYLCDAQFTDDAWTVRRGENLDFSVID